MSTTIDIKLRTGGYLYPAKATEDKGRLYLQFAYNKALLAEIKAMNGAKWHGFEDPPRKVWSIPINPRNKFQLEFLQGRNPYAPYDKPLVLDGIPETRYHLGKQREMKLFRHQPEMTAHMLQRHAPGCIVAGEMGTSKTLSAIMSMEILDARLGKGVWWYVAPRSGLSATHRELILWKANVQPDLMTYEAMTSRMKNWVPGTRPPRGIILDEAHNLKTLTSQRAIAAMGLSNAIRDEYGEDGSVILMSGSPAPNTPSDWYSLAEIACPGFLKEGDIYKFKNRLAVIVMKEGLDRGSYPSLVTWRDSESKCHECGQLQNSPEHIEGCAETYHPFVAGQNEVAKLYKRLKGLTVVYFKKNCLDLPDKTYRIIEIKPNKSVLRAASVIAKTSKTTIAGLTLLRELSDGFQYREVAIGQKICPMCLGSRHSPQPLEKPDSCPNCRKIAENAPDKNILIMESDFGTATQLCGNHTPEIELVDQTCPTCGGIGQVDEFERTTQAVPCPKYDILTDLLEEYDEVGRVVIYGGFTGTIDRIVEACLKQQWCVIRMDQGATKIMDATGAMLGIKDFQMLFQDMQTAYQRVAFVGHPASAGTGLTLTASPVIIYVSNTFKTVDRIQSEDRIHRPGMDINLGATIIDIVHLPSDKKILENLKIKRDLQALSLGELSAIANSEEERAE